MVNVVSFSGGKDSTCMLLMMLEKGMQVDEIVFCDTGVEFSQMYEHIDKVEKYIGRKITRLKADHDFWWYATRQPMSDSGRWHGLYGLNWPWPTNRWCTGILKTRVISKYFRGKNTIQYVGIAADETKRIKSEHYPLVDWGITEADALAYCKQHGFNWGGLYDHLKRVCCWCCPLQPLSEAKILHDNFPELWQELLKKDKCMRNTWRRDYSVAQLEVKFAIEDEAVKQGLSPRSREVQHRVKEALK